MHAAIRIVELAPSEMPMSDPVYDRLRFARTDPACTRMVVARAGPGNSVVGLGRLIDLGIDAHGEPVLELGGMWVDEGVRRQGLGGRLIEALLAWVPAGSPLWCTPFAELMPLYAAHGFLEVREGGGARATPDAVAKRLALCGSAQDRPVLVTCRPPVPE